MCIRNHRGSVSSDKDSIEELCVADADAISHFDNVPSLLYLAYAERKMSMDEGLRFVKSKLERSFHKLSAGSKEYYKDKYRRVMEMLGDDDRKSLYGEEEKQCPMNLDKLHTTDLGVLRIRKNLSLDEEDVVAWCKDKIKAENADITRKGKNWYISVDGCIITVNAHSYTIITAHRE